MKTGIRPFFDKFSERIDSLALRERILIFAAITFALIAAIDALFLNPLLQRQKLLSTELGQKQEKMKELQAQLQLLIQAKQEDERSPLRERIKALRASLQEGEAYLQNRRDRLVSPDKMADLLEQVLNRNPRVQMVALENLPPTPLLESGEAQAAEPKTALQQDRLVYKHGVRITLRGSYADLLDYLQALEQLPTQMFWGAAVMKVLEHPALELTLTIYTLSLNTIWLQV